MDCLELRLTVAARRLPTAVSALQNLVQVSVRGTVSGLGRRVEEDVFWMKVKIVICSEKSLLN